MFLMFGNDRPGIYGGRIGGLGNIRVGLTGECYHEDSLENMGSARQNSLRLLCVSGYNGEVKAGVPIKIYHSLCKYSKILYDGHKNGPTRPLSKSLCLD